MKKKIQKILTWMPRILMIIFIAFISMFSFDVWGEDYTLAEKFIGFFMHNIPTFALILLLMLSWKKERIGGILFILISVFFTLAFNTYEDLINYFLISFPPLLIGGMMVTGYYLKK